MNRRVILTLTPLLALGFVAAPALAAPKKAPIKLAWKAQATPDPTATDQTTKEHCVGVIPTSTHHYEFKVPAAGTLEVQLNNSLDWAVAIRDAAGDEVAGADGGSPEVKEVVSVKFKKAQTISIDTCNFAGEPEISPTGVFTFK